MKKVQTLGSEVRSALSLWSRNRLGWFGTSHSPPERLKVTRTVEPSSLESAQPDHDRDVGIIKKLVRRSTGSDGDAPGPAMTQGLFGRPTIDADVQHR
jgi:hypothetical protein